MCRLWHCTSNLKLQVQYTICIHCSYCLKTSNHHWSKLIYCNVVSKTLDGYFFSHILWMKIHVATSESLPAIYLSCDNLLCWFLLHFLFTSVHLGHHQIDTVNLKMKEINRVGQSLSTWGEPILVFMGTSWAAKTVHGKDSDLLVVHSPNNEWEYKSQLLLKSNNISSQAKQTASYSSLCFWVTLLTYTDSINH